MNCEICGHEHGPEIGHVNRIVEGSTKAYRRKMLSILSRNLHQHVGKTIKNVETGSGANEIICEDSVRIVFTDGTYLLLKADWRGADCYISDVCGELSLPNEITWLSDAPDEAAEFSEEMWKGLKLMKTRSWDQRGPGMFAGFNHDGNRVAIELEATGPGDYINVPGKPARK